MSIPHRLHYFFNPKSIAIIGASQNLDSISGRPIKYLRKHGFKGEVFPVNPKYQEIAGYKCYGSLMEIPAVPDLVLLIIRAELVIDFLEQCVIKGCKNIVIVSSGFAENSTEGSVMQEKIKEIARVNGLNICGPNSQGLLNLKAGVAATFSAALETDSIVKGPLGFVSQSGAFGYSTFCLGQEENIGFSYVIGTGNEAVLDLMDYMEFMLLDQDVKIVASYAEAIRNGKKLTRVCETALKNEKPLIMLKVGRSEVGRRAALSHTAALAGSDEVFDGVCKQYGITRADNINEIFDVCKLFMNINKLPEGKRVAIVSTSGGAGVMMVDKCIELGLEIPDFSEDTRDGLVEVVPSLGTTQNPVDVSAQIISSADRFKKAMNLVLADSSVDVLAILVTMATGARAEQFAADLAEVAAQADKPIVVSWSATKSLTGKAFDILDQAGIPRYQTPVQAALALKAFLSYAQYRKSWLEKGRDSLHPVIDINHQRKARAVDFISQHKGAMTEYEFKILLSMYGIPVTNEVIARSPREAVGKAAEIGYPVAIKICSPKILHKSDIGGIKTNIQTNQQVESAYVEITGNAGSHYPGEDIKEVLVQEMITEGYEVILGGINDPQFGPVVMFGLGGVYVEVYKDVSYRVAPLSYQDALEMIEEVRGSAILKGARGKQKGDLAALANAITAFSQMIIELKDNFKEIDINPLIVLPEGRGVKIVDALVVTK